MLKMLKTPTGALITLLFALFGTRCSDEKIVQPQQTFDPVLSNLIAPGILYNASPVFHVVAVDVEDPQGLSDIASVTLVITDVSTGTQVLSGQLQDDGLNGDNIPNDGQFSTRIQGAFAQNPGEYELTVSAVDNSGNSGNRLSSRVQVLAGRENQPPELLQVAAPSEIEADSTFDFLLTAEVTDPEGLSDVRKVFYQFFPPAHPNPTREDTLTDSGTLGDLVAGDGVYTVNLRSNLIDEAADFTFRVQAEDKSGNKSLAKIVLIRGVFRNPQAPVISNLVAPDTVQVDANNVVQILMTVDVFDPQGLSDIKFVRFRSFLPDGNEATNSPFDLSDDGDTGATGDAVAGDGTYSILINLPPGTNPGDFRFVFQAEDKSGEQSNVIEHTLTVIP